MKKNHRNIKPLAGSTNQVFLARMETQYLQLKCSFPSKQTSVEILMKHIRPVTSWNRYQEKTNSSCNLFANSMHWFLQARISIQNKFTYWSSRIEKLPIKTLMGEFKQVVLEQNESTIKTNYTNFHIWAFSANYVSVPMKEDCIFKIEKLCESKKILDEKLMEETQPVVSKDIQLKLLEWSNDVANSGKYGLSDFHCRERQPKFDLLAIVYKWKSVHWHLYLTEVAGRFGETKVCIWVKTVSVFTSCQFRWTVSKSRSSTEIFVLRGTTEARKLQTETLIEKMQPVVLKKKWIWWISKLIRYICKFSLRDQNEDNFHRIVFTGWKLSIDTLIDENQHWFWKNLGLNFEKIMNVCTFYQFQSTMYEMQGT